MTSCPLADSRYHPLPDGGQLRYALYEPPAAPIGTILIAPGRREFIEKKYAELGPDLLRRGYRLIFMEWRGQGLSSRFVPQPVFQRDHITDFAIHMGDLSSFYDSVVKPGQAGPLILLGHSMGAHLLLRWQMENPGLAAALILTGPMMALAGYLVHTSAHALCWGAIKLGYGTDYAPMQHDYNAEDAAFDYNPLTNDAQRFRIIEDYFKAHPQLTVGGISWSWLDAAIKSMQFTQTAFRLEAVKLPVLAVYGGDDRVTPVDENARHLRKIPGVELHMIEGGRHDIMNETDPRRAQAWQFIDGFLGQLARPA